MQNNLAWFNSCDRHIETASEIYDSLKNCVKDKDILEYVTPDIIREIFQKIFERADAVFDFGNVESPEDFMRDYNLQDKHSAAVELFCQYGDKYYKSVSNWLKEYDNEYVIVKNSYTLPDGQVVYVEGYYGYN